MSTNTNKRYRYDGPLSGLSLQDGTSVRLTPGGEVSLPSDLRYVRSLVAKKMLTEVEAQPSSAKARVDNTPSRSASGDAPPKTQRAPRAREAKTSSNQAEATAEAAAPPEK